MTQACRRVAEAVAADTLWDRLGTLAAIGATPAGGVDRQALTAGDAEARRALLAWAAAAGLAASQDRAGNLFFRRSGAEDTAPVLTGSHLDTQPDGGRFDGAYGVVAGLAVLEALERAGVRTRRPVELAVWNNEEGCRFAPGAMGSAAFAGRLDLAAVLGTTDRDGVTLGAALDALFAAFPEVPMRSGESPPVHAFVEVHIEQGPVLEQAGRTIGIVTGIQGVRWFEVTVTGAPGHAGTTPRSARRDALLPAVALIAELDGLCRDATDTTRFTVGRIAAEPGSVNAIPGRVVFTIDLRHPDEAELDRLEDAVRRVCGPAGGAGAVAVEVRRTQAIAPTAFPSWLTGMVERHARGLDLPVLALPSGAFHDSLNLAAVCPTAMVFVPCREGISHNPAESATPGDLAAGARVLAATLAELAGPLAE